MALVLNKEPCHCQDCWAAVQASMISTLLLISMTFLGWATHSSYKIRAVVFYFIFFPLGCWRFPGGFEVVQLRYIILCLQQVELERTMWLLEDCQVF